MKKSYNVAFTWWWSWGHILPIISLLQKIDNTSQYRQVIDKMYWFGEKNGMEYKFFKQYSTSFSKITVQFLSIIAGKYRRETIRISRLRNIRDVFLFPMGIIQSLFLLLFCRIDMIFCKWWYVSLPVVIAWRLLRKKIYVHDSDTKPWLTNRLASKFATQNFAWFENTLIDSICVWQILSDQLLEFDISNLVYNKKIEVLVAGWSLGAKKLYDGVIWAIKTMTLEEQGKYHFTFINGHHLIDYNDLKNLSSCITITDLITDQGKMWLLYAQSDIAIVRWWTTTLAECKLFDLPLVIVPLPVTHDQYGNAQYYVKKYDDCMFSQNDSQFVDNIYSYIVKSKKKQKIFDMDKLIASIQEAKIIILNKMLISSYK